MEKRGYLIIGVIGLVAAGGLVLFLVFTQSKSIFKWDGDESGNPTGQTIVISGAPLKPNKFAIMVGRDFEYSGQEHEIGTFNLTHQDTGQNFTMSYELSAGTFVGIHYAGVTLELPPGSYTISAENHHLGGASCDQVLWHVIHVGYLRATDSISGEIPDNAEGWLTGLLGFGAFFLGMGGLIGALKGRSCGLSYDGTKSFGTGALTFLILWVIGMVIGSGLDWNTGIGIALGGGCGGCILMSTISWISTPRHPSQEVRTPKTLL